MPRSYSLPWMILAGIILTGFAAFVESIVLAPVADGIMGTSPWQNPGNPHAAAGMGMVGDFVNNVLAIAVLSIWFGIFLLSRWEI